MRDWRCLIGIHKWVYESTERIRVANERRPEIQYPPDGRSCMRCPRRERRVFGMTEDWWEKTK